MRADYSDLEVTPSDGLISKPPEHSDLEVRDDSMRKTTGTFEPYGSESNALYRAERSGKDDRICSLRKTTFWLTLALVVVTVAGIVGGSVGGAISAQSQSSDELREASSAEYESSLTRMSTDSSTTSTIPPPHTTPTTSSTSSAVTSGSTGLAAMDCVDGRKLASEVGVVYEEFCAEDWTDGYDGVQDIRSTTRYTFQACMEACDSYNAARDNSKEPECLAVTYEANLTTSIRDWDANCFLKDAKGKGRSARKSTASAAKVR